MKLDLKKNLSSLNFLTEFNWDFTLHFKENLIKDFTTEEEISFLKEIGNFVSRCKLETKENKKYAYVDYLLPIKEKSFLAKGINQFVTSSLIDTIHLDVYNRNHNIEFSYICPVKDKNPEWYITFGTKEGLLTLNVIYELEDIKIA